MAPARSTLAQADGDGPSVDTVSIPLGRSAYVRSIRDRRRRREHRRSLLRRRFGRRVRPSRRGHRQAPRSHRRARACAVAGARAAAARTGAEQGRRVSRARQHRGTVVAAPPTPSWRQSPRISQDRPRPRRRRTGGPGGRWAARPGYDTGRDCVLSRAGADVPSPLTAASASTTPCPTTGSHPAAGRCAVSSMRRMTCRAVNSGDRDRTNATMPAHHRRCITRTRDRYRVAGRRQATHQALTVGIQRHDAFARRCDVHPRPGQAER